MGSSFCPTSSSRSIERTKGDASRFSAFWPKPFVPDVSLSELRCPMRACRVLQLPRSGMS